MFFDEIETAASRMEGRRRAHIFQNADRPTDDDIGVDAVNTDIDLSLAGFVPGSSLAACHTRVVAKYLDDKKKGA